jgi:hypothetical protein
VQGERNVLEWWVRLCDKIVPRCLHLPWPAFSAYIRQLLGLPPTHTPTHTHTHTAPDSPSPSDSDPRVDLGSSSTDDSVNLSSCTSTCTEGGKEAEAPERCPASLEPAEEVRAELWFNSYDEIYIIICKIYVCCACVDYHRYVLLPSTSDWGWVSDFCM